MSNASIRTAEPDDVPEIASHAGKEPGKTSRKKDTSGEGKKEKKLKTQQTGAGRLKNKPSAQSVQVATVEPTDGLVASVIVVC